MVVPTSSGLALASTGSASRGRLEFKWGLAVLLHDCISVRGSWSLAKRGTSVFISLNCSRLAIPLTADKAANYCLTPLLSSAFTRFVSSLILIRLMISVTSHRISAKGRKMKKRRDITNATMFAMRYGIPFSFIPM